MRYYEQNSHYEWAAGAKANKGGSALDGAETRYSSNVYSHPHIIDQVNLEEVFAK